MGIAPEILEAMKDAGASIDVILAAIRADQAMADKAAEERRAKDTERQRRHRASRPVTAVTRDKRDTPPNEDILTPPVFPTKPSGLEPNRRKMPIPENWEPSQFTAGTQSRQVVDGWPHGEQAAQVEQFKAHHRAKGNKFHDPQDAWSTWVLNTRKFGVGRNEQRIGKTTAAIAALGGFNDDSPM